MAIVSRIPRGNYALYKLISVVPTQSGSLTYTGSAVSPTWNNYDTDQLDIGGTYSATNTGTYTATFTPKHGYRWWDKSTGAKTATWSIWKQSLAVPTGSGSYTYNGGTQYIVFMGLDTSTMETSGTLSAINAGSYSANVSLRDTANYQWNDGTTAQKGYSWSIAKITLTPPTSSGSYTYNKTQQTLAFSGYSSSTMTKGGTYAATNAGSYTATISLKDTTNYQWNNGTTTARSYPWSIAKATVNAPSFSGGGYTYDGTEKSITVTGFDSGTMTKSGTFAATNAGSYTATVSLTDTANYLWSGGGTAAKSYAWGIAKISITAPTASGSYTYDGAEKSIVFTGFNSNTMTKGGTYSATNAGNYSATVALKDATNYQWSDGTTAEKGYSWSIAKANPAVPTLSKYSDTFTEANSKSFTVTRSGDGAVNASSSNTSVATVSVSGTTVIVTGLRVGTATITVTVAAGTNYNAYTGTGAQYTATGTLDISYCLTFSGAEVFTLQANIKGWNGTLRYTDGNLLWTEWANGNAISSSSNGKLYVRGTGNTVITGTYSSRKWIISTQASCTGNIETLLDYQTVARGEHPAMGEYCFAYLFDGATITTSPELPATTLTKSCYRSMLAGTLITAPPVLPATTLAEDCYNQMLTNTLITASPELPATTLAVQCYRGMMSSCTQLTRIAKLPASGKLPRGAYQSMYNRCTQVKLSSSYSSEYRYPFRIPTQGEATDGGSSLSEMFSGTGGSVTYVSRNTTYYTTEEPV